ncbi:MAG: hypothetical protein GC165_13540 [Armatimonadetes bacterium]|nr:hypothetical protein [Armatimonadota bacterium]MBS1725904.1 ribonuclease E inhibitor RraB [Armatimonadota bacterium]
MSSLDDLRAKLQRPCPDQTMRGILQEHGDDGTKSRSVKHVAYFNTPEGIDGFSKYVQEAGYTLEESPEKDAVAFSNESSVVGEAFDESVQHLKEKAEEFDGQYDGWGCSVVLD